MEYDDEKERTSDRRYAQQEGGLATAGGGDIPNGGAPVGHGAAPEDGEDVKNVDPNATNQDTTLGNINASDIPAQGTLGGRNPGQLNKNIGDMDRPREHSGIENGPIDPMTSRAPNKVNEHHKEDPQKEQ
jgi:hypothetical protein